MSVLKKAIKQLFSIQDNNVSTLLLQAKEGFKSLSISEKWQQQALKFLEQWLSDPQFSDYIPQIEYLIKNSSWDYLLDSFYQIIPFGTGGRRGEVGIGPNRINPWTIKDSAQGHSQYLIKHYGKDAQKKGIVIAYDVRQFFGNKFLSNNISNPVKNLSSKTLSQEAASVYATNGIKVYFFDDFNTTPELSFTIRHMKAVGGVMISASHNPPEHNGKKVYDEFGGQLIPPHDEELVNEVTKNVKEIKQVSFAEAQKQGLIEVLGDKLHQAYLKAAASVSLSSSRNLKIAYTPLHGCGTSSVYETMKMLGFDIEIDPETGNPSGKFENVTFNIPNPEVEQSFDTSLKFAQKIKADILLSSDPDADRIGVMVRHQGNWLFLNGNEIAAILCNYAINKRRSTLIGKGVVIKTAVTTNVVRKICQENDIEIIGDLLVGYKYIADQMNKLEEVGRMDNFILGCEESHGYNAGNYARDKDAVTPAIWLSELAAELKPDGKTLVDYLNEVYAKYSYFRNYLTEIRLPGTEGILKIDKIQTTLRTSPPQGFAEFEVEKVFDSQNLKPIVSETDLRSKNVLTFYFKTKPGTTSIVVTLRPSGTEPKIKMYFEIGSLPFAIEEISKIREKTEKILRNLEKAILLKCYQIIGIDFPERGFLLFWQLPIDLKMKYFEIENQVVALKDVQDKKQRQDRLNKTLEFLGADPIEKVDKAFMAKFGSSIRDYLDI